jgi:hypothetical protein
MSGLKENGMPNDEVLAVVNKIHNQKSRTLQIFPQFIPATTMVLFTHFWSSRVELDQGDKWKDASSDVPRKE